jgi:hypothetical protein
MMAGKRDTRRDRAGLGPDPAESRRRLVSIDTIAGFEIASGEPDVRGWNVRTLGDRALGQVEDLLIDPDRKEVVMLEVALHGNDVRAEIPLRSAQLDRERKVVIVDSGDVESGTTRRVDVRDEVRDVPDEEVRQVRAEEPRTARVEERLETDDVEERVVESHPYVEEVIVRRRRVEE